MTRDSTESDRKAQLLRRDAEDRLSTGTVPPPGGSPLDKEALSRLYAMASDPERSSDALRLLQELQVHQVELDLQREELGNSEREMSRELSLYKALFELTPTLSLVVTLGGRIVEANQAAASLLDTGHDDLLGRALQDFLKQESHASWHELLRKLGAGEQTASCEMLVNRDGKEVVTMTLSGSFLPVGDVLLFGVLSSGPGSNDFSKHQQQA